MEHTMTITLKRQAERMYAVFAELVRRYQFRDRDQVCFHGLSVSQCYTLELLADAGPRTMGALAAEICLKVSTATRVVDPLIWRGLATRREDPNDRRVCRVRITRAGRAVVARVRAKIIAEYQAVLKTVPAASRPAVIAALSHMLSAFKRRQCCVTDRPGDKAATDGQRRRVRRQRRHRPASP
jgi:MarR family transcriptional regulator, 2-MHQ and catechol-resistance regulon repressor